MKPLIHFPSRQYSFSELAGHARAAGQEDIAERCLYYAGQRRVAPFRTSGRIAPASPFPEVGNQNLKEAA